MPQFRRMISFSSLFLFYYLFDVTPDCCIYMIIVWDFCACLLFTTAWYEINISFPVIVADQLWIISTFANNAPRFHYTAFNAKV